MSEHLAAAAAAAGIPEDLLQRSADARAAADGGNADDLLAAWAGGAPVPASVPPADTPAVAPDEAPDAPVSEAPPVELPSAAPIAASAAVASSPPAAERVTGAAALDYDAVVTVPTSGLTERTAPSTPRWLALMLFAIPLFGLGYLVTFANGPNCGVGGQLAVDRLTGEVENCDGSEFVAAGDDAGGGVNVRDVIAQGAGVYTDSACTACHGASGGGGVGPAFDAGAVIDTFGACSDHLEWVELGSSGFQSAGRDTYGDTATAVSGGMPGFSSLSPSDLAAVVLYERVQFGGQDPTEAALDCGLISPPEDAPAADETALEG